MVYNIIRNMVYTIFRICKIIRYKYYKFPQYIVLVIKSDIAIILMRAKSNFIKKCHNRIKNLSTFNLMTYLDEFNLLNNKQ